ncbi:MAG: HAD family phosphatase [Fibrobacter sp.]|nr:HAD family phosphatase [Fibrobacter sp.]
MESSEKMTASKPGHLFAFDLDGTLLNSQKQISAANLKALKEISESGSVVAFASGRLGSSMSKFLGNIDIDIAMLTLNGAEVYTDKSHGSKLVHNAPLPPDCAHFLIDYFKADKFNLNYYSDGKLYSVRSSSTQPWIDLYYRETSTVFNFIESFELFRGKSPSKIIFVGEPPEIDKQESFFRTLWGDSIYICRTWDYYLEFLNPHANKGEGLQSLARSYGLSMKDVIAFGDASNDIPMLKEAGLGIAVGNASVEVKNAADKVSTWTNDQDAVAMEWELLSNSKTLALR